MFDVASCIGAANGGRLDDWVHRYLGGGPWANAALSDGLRRQQRYWIGPLRLPSERLVRCCGPEPEMAYRVPIEAWHKKVSGIASSLADPMRVPPLILEWRAAILSIRDGNHRHAAMRQAGWSACWVVIWCNSPGDCEAARKAVDAS
jgi:hypothetical protein